MDLDLGCYDCPVPFGPVAIAFVALALAFAILARLARSRYLIVSYPAGMMAIVAGAAFSAPILAVFKFGVVWHGDRWSEPSSFLALSTLVLIWILLAWLVCLPPLRKKRDAGGGTPRAWQPRIDGVDDSENKRD